MSRRTLLILVQVLLAVTVAGCGSSSTTAFRAHYFDVSAMVKPGVEGPVFAKTNSLDSEPPTRTMNTPMWFGLTPSGPAISSRGALFTRHYGISTTVARRWLGRIGEQGVLTIDLKESPSAAAIATKTRQPRGLGRDVPVKQV